GHAAEVYQANFTARHAQLGVVVHFRHELGTGSGGSAQLAALARVQLNVVHLGTSWDVSQRHGVAGSNRNTLATHHRIANADAQRSQDVAFCTICVKQQGDAGGSVGIVFDGGDTSRN